MWETRNPHVSFQGTRNLKAHSLKPLTLAGENQMTTINLDILNGELIEEEIEVQVEFDYDAAEPETGYHASVGIYEVRRVDNNAELCLLPVEEDRIEVELLEQASAKESEARYHAVNGWERY